MKYYKVVIKDGDDEVYSNKLFFDFDTIEKAFNFAKRVIETTYYDIEILQCEYSEDNNG